MDMRAEIEIGPPESRLIRKRIAARTTAIHASAIVNEPWARDIVRHRDPDGYVQRHQFPDEIVMDGAAGRGQTLSRDAAWQIADRNGEYLEWAMLSGLTGRVAAFFSTHGQGIYANFGRPTMDFSAFFRDRISRVAGSNAPGLGSLRVGPLFIAFDTTAAASLTALGHVARRANLASGTVVTDVLSTGAYEGGSAWVSAKLGVVTGVRAMGATALMPIPGARFAALVAGFAVGAATAMAVKRVTNQLKDKAIDVAYESTERRRVSSRAETPIE